MPSGKLDRGEPLRAGRTRAARRNRGRGRPRPPAPGPRRAPPARRDPGAHRILLPGHPVERGAGQPGTGNRPKACNLHGSASTNCPTTSSNTPRRTPRLPPRTRRPDRARLDVDTAHLSAHQPGPAAEDRAGSARIARRGYGERISSISSRVFAAPSARMEGALDGGESAGRSSSPSRPAHAALRAGGAGATATPKRSPWRVHQLQVEAIRYLRVLAGAFAPARPSRSFNANAAAGPGTSAPRRSTRSPASPPNGPVDGNETTACPSDGGGSGAHDPRAAPPSDHRTSVQAQLLL